MFNIKFINFNYNTLCFEFGTNNFFSSNLNVLTFFFFYQNCGKLNFSTEFALIGNFGLVSIGMDLSNDQKRKKTKAING